MTERFNKAISALVKGFINGTIVVGHCEACAAGNIIAESLGYTIVVDKTSLRKAFVWKKGRDKINAQWYDIVLDYTIYGIKNDSLEIDSTGYSLRQIIAIEEAFEDAARQLYKDEPTKTELLQAQYKGLMAVVDVLCEIEQIDSAETKQLFNHPKLQTA